MPTLTEAVIESFITGITTVTVNVKVTSNDGTVEGSTAVQVPYTYLQGCASFISGVESSVSTFISGLGVPAPSNFTWLCVAPSQLAPVAYSGVYSDLTGKPTFAAVATSGAYSDLSGKPTLATVATSGAYADLSGKPSLATVATTGAYSDLSGLPTIPTSPYKSYQALVSQSGTSVPTQTALNNDFGATTFTWARTSAGVYTLTANAATFTSGKTAAIISMPNNPLANFKYTVTSTTVLTFGTSLNGILSLILTPTPTDALLSSTLVEVRVYP